MSALDGVGVHNGNLFGFDATDSSASLIVIPVPWDVTVSFRAGTAHAYENVLAASTQLDFCIPGRGDDVMTDIFMLPVSQDWILENKRNRKIAKEIIDLQESGRWDDSLEKRTLLEIVNRSCQKMQASLAVEVKKYMSLGKKVALLGGDHSVSYPLIKTVSQFYESFGILQIDAHCDLRDTYQGFETSHASVMHRALGLEQVSRLVQVGIRDYCHAELAVIRGSGGRVCSFFDRNLKESKFRGLTWEAICQPIVSALPDNVYVSLDVDGLDPSLCPNTGTPVPGGLGFEELVFLLNLIRRAGKRVIAFDLVEVGTSEDYWDESVAARLLYFLSQL